MRLQKTQGGMLLGHPSTTSKNKYIHTITSPIRALRNSDNKIAGCKWVPANLTLKTPIWTSFG